ncbi:MAG TPA: ABC transporter permease [Chitinophagaceae bacterium]|nr:ABC transporter permease [Chitinophagaceae bacterium]
MIKNYFKTAWRNVSRNKIFSFINIVGLAIGISASLVIYLIVSFDLSFDKFEKNGDRIYRVVSDMKFPDQDFKNAGVPMPLIPAAQKELTGIEMFIPLSQPGGLNVSITPDAGSKPAVFKNQSDIVYADNNLLRMLQYQWIAGSPKNSLSVPFTTVLTESRARAYFPGNDVSKAIGKTIAYNDSIQTTVTGIVKDITATTDFTFKEFISYSTIENSGLKNNVGWGQWSSVNSSNQFLVQLNGGTNAELVSKQLQELFNKNRKDAYLENIFSLQPLADIHFNSDYGTYTEPQAHKPTLYGLLAVAAILLILGCINFINLTTAQAVQRAKEIGIRKTMGGSRSQLMLQFINETFFLTLIATLLSISFVPLIIQLFADFIPPAVNTRMLMNTGPVTFITVLLILVTLLSGFYPAWVLSKYKPVLVLKNQAYANTSASRTAWVRKTLTVAQFVFAQSFVIAALIVGAQIQYTLNKDLGFKKDGIITFSTFTNWNDFDNPKPAIQKREVLLHRLQALPGINKVCLGGAPPASNGTSMQTMKYNNGKKEIETTVEVKYADEDYFKLYNMQLIAGKFPQRSDSLIEYAINENYARFLGFKNPADAVGKMIEHGDGGGIPIVGVLKDFYSQSLHAAIQPLVYYSIYGNESKMHIALQPETKPGEWKTTIAQIEKAFKEVYPEQDFTYVFVDETIAKFYDKEQHTSTLLSYATGLAIFISCLGLLGLVIYTTNQRTKEIGVRKVLGASVLQIVSLISKDFLKLVIIAFVIAAPLAWWGMNEWLKNFAYHTQLNIWLFAAAGFIMIVIAFLTLAFQTFNAASANPVKSLRTE